MTSGNVVSLDRLINGRKDEMIKTMSKKPRTEKTPSPATVPKNVVAQNV